MTQGPNLYTQIQQERKGRWARRDLSPHPLTDVERAERRHHWIESMWALLLWFAPLMVSGIAGLLAMQIMAPILMAIALFAARLLAVLAQFALSLVLPHPNSRVGFWIIVAAMTASSGALFVSLYVAVGSGQIPLEQAWASILCLAVLPIWPLIFRGLHSNHVTDFERHLAAASTPPQGIIE